MTKKQIYTTIHDIIAGINPLDQLEEQHIQFVLQWIDSGAEIFRLAKPATPDTHLVCYFVVFDPETNKILLTAHRKSGLWLPPGGHVELDEHPMITVIREAKEELGIEAECLFEDPFYLTIAKTVGASQHTDISLWYLLKGSSIVSYSYDREEFDQIHWFQPQEIPYSLSDPHIERLINKLNKSLTLNAYDNSVQKFVSNTQALHPREQAKNFLSLLPGKRILDLGCGPGRDAQVFVERGFQVIGVDLSSKMIEVAKSRVDAQFYIMDMENLDFLPYSFDGVWASASLLHIPKKRILQVLKNIYSFLVKEGVFYLSLKKGSGEGLQSDPRYGDVQKFWSFFEKEEIEEILKRADFEIIQSTISERKSTDRGHLLWVNVLCKKGGQ